MSKGAATIEELRRAVETLKRNDRRTREELRDIRDVINDFEWRFAPNTTTATVTFRDIHGAPEGTFRVKPLPTDVIPPPPGANPSGVAGFLRRFFLRFKRKARNGQSPPQPSPLPRSTL
jgi:hypothetical protein